METPSISKLIMIGIIVGLIVFGGGYTVGSMSAMSYCVDIGFKFLKMNNITIDINKELLAKGLFQYKEQVSGLR